MNGDILLTMPTDLRPPPEPGRSHHGASRRGVMRLTVDVPAAAAPSGRATEGTGEKPARWNTPEFYVYYLVFAFAVPWMFWIPISLSQQTHPNFDLYRHYLRPGWLFGRPYDNSDVQYRSFRSNIPALVAFLAVFFVIKRIYVRSAGRSSYTPLENDKTYLLPFYTLFSLVMLLVLHGSSAFKVLAILLCNYSIAHFGKGARWVIPITWAFNTAVLFANEFYGGYTYASLSDRLAFLDGFRGVYPRWHVSFNITMLRLVSFNSDSNWAHNKVGTSDSGANLTHKQRTTTYHALDAYTLRNYLAYALYPPLYIAGPIMTFNDWLWQLARPQPPALPSVFRYAARFVVTLALMEFILHFMYVGAIKDAKAWGGDSPAELCMVGFWNLIFVWLKLLLPWRFFRMWALFDGVDPPENMVRCMANNYSTLGFWRSWHRSYNLWIVRYIYIPLGGNRHVILSSLLVFTFVALWHDLSFKLLAWGWLVTLFIVPEVTARRIFTPAKYGTAPWFRPLAASGAVLNILLMMAANLVGFVVGLDGVRYMAHEIAGSLAGARFLAGACAALYVGVQVMFEYREEELRNGIDRRC